MNKIKVLDHGYVRLVDHMGNDLSIVRSARQSYDAAWRAGGNEASDTKLINYLWKNKHTTPFEAVTFTFEVVAPIFVLRQWMRHRTWSYNELSARYKELPDVFYIPDTNKVGVQSKDNKQGRTVDLEKENDYAVSCIAVACEAAFDTYKELLKTGVPRELARIVLPLSTYSSMFATVNLLNLLKFIDLRSHHHAQWEIQQYAKALLDLITSVVPVTVGAYNATKISN